MHRVRLLKEDRIIRRPVSYATANLYLQHNIGKIKLKKAWNSSKNNEIDPLYPHASIYSKLHIPEH